MKSKLKYNHEGYMRKVVERAGQQMSSFNVENMSSSYEVRTNIRLKLNDTLPLMCASMFSDTYVSISIGTCSDDDKVFSFYDDDSFNAMVGIMASHLNTIIDTLMSQVKKIEDDGHSRVIVREYYPYGKEKDPELLFFFYVDGEDYRASFSRYGDEYKLSMNSAPIEHAGKFLVYINDLFIPMCVEHKEKYQNKGKVNDKKDN